MAGAIIVMLWLTAIDAPPPGFQVFERLCIANESQPATVTAAAADAGFTPDPARPARLVNGGQVLTLGRSAMKSAKNLGDIALTTCSLTLPGFSQADVDALSRWMGHAANYKADLPMGAFVMIDKASGPHEMAFNRPDKAQTALRTGRLRLVSAEKVGEGLRLMYAVVAPDAGAKP